MMSAEKKGPGREFDRLRQAIQALTRAIAALPSPEERVSAVGSALEAIENEAAELLQVRLTAVEEMRDAGFSYDRIAFLTGLSKARVAQLSRLSRDR